jgi:membrane-associated phospholipid phosphatase
MIPGRHPRIGIWLIAAPFAAGMVAISWVDYAWTVHLTTVRIPVFVDVMRRTVFEGDGLGGSDASILLFLGVIVLYLRAQGARAGARLVAWRPTLGFLLTSALAAGLGAVHAVKWVLGRARPWSVLGREHLPYSEWYQVGAHYITQGLYRGSFPSGHTAAVFVLMTLVYAFHGDETASPARRGTAWALGALVLAYTAAMGIASSMARSHWLSDALGSTGLVWILIHLLYFRVLRVPEQRHYRRRTGGELPLPRYWELRLCALGFGALMGAIAIGLGLRAFWEEAPPYLAAGIPLGAALCWVFFPRAKAVVMALHAALASTA